MNNFLKEYSNVSCKKLKPVESNLFVEMVNLWQTLDWGEHFEKNRRPINQKAIYDNTRVIFWNQYTKKGNTLLRELANKSLLDIQDKFNKKINLMNCEMTLLLPNGFVDWHHDMLFLSKVTTRLMVPLINSNQIEYFFCNWAKNTPTVMPNFPAKHYLTEPIYQTTMDSGNYYVFNHRIPHKNS